MSGCAVHIRSVLDSEQWCTNDSIFCSISKCVSHSFNSAIFKRAEAAGVEYRNVYRRLTPLAMPFAYSGEAYSGL